jgi:uncharacterized protein with FMN-binding domain
VRRVLAAIFGTAVGTVMLIALKTGPSTGKATAPVAATTAPLAPAPSGPTGAPRGPAGAAGTFTGSVAQTEYGPVQVRIVMAGGRMTDATAVQLPKSSSRSNQLSGRAAPILRQEALSAQSASIDTVSGATFTSAGYRNSLQAALDAAKRG